MLRLLVSLKLTISCLAALMVLVLACTLAQVKLGTRPAEPTCGRGSSGGTCRAPRGASRCSRVARSGLVLIVNLLAAQISRLELSWKKTGL